MQKKQQTSFEIMKTPFLMFQSHYTDYYNMSKDCVKGIQEETILSKIFFSPQNVDLLQKQIIGTVFKRTNGAYLIEKQNEEDLQVVMRSMFLQHARHVADHIKEQIQELNNLVTDDVVPNIISEVNQYIGYLDRTFLPRQIMDHPECVSSAGMRTLPSVTRTFDPTY
uniref:Minor capsid protein P8 central region domain-containing protein n=1 Tax=viral metagenome TaxID=1070528 RepID=A0A6C0C9H9_9ZZZZ